MQVFDELRNLCLGLAARAVPWSLRSPSQQLSIWGSLIQKLFSNLFTRAEYIAESLVARGIHNFDTYPLNVPDFTPPKLVPSLVAALLLVGSVYLAVQHAGAA
jgi:energy-coupling factor transporter transmembrane protein EcfT